MYVLNYLHITSSDGFRGVRKGRTHPLNFEQLDFFFFTIFINCKLGNICLKNVIVSMYTWPLLLVLRTPPPPSDLAFFLYH